MHPKFKGERFCGLANGSSWTGLKLFIVLLLLIIYSIVGSSSTPTYEPSIFKIYQMYLDDIRPSRAWTVPRWIHFRFYIFFTVCRMVPEVKAVVCIIISGKAVRFRCLSGIEEVKSIASENT